MYEIVMPFTRLYRVCHCIHVCVCEYACLSVVKKFIVILFVYESNLSIAYILDSKGNQVGVILKYDFFTYIFQMISSHVFFIKFFISDLYEATSHTRFCTLWLLDSSHMTQIKNGFAARKRIICSEVICLLF